MLHLVGSCYTSSTVWCVDSECLRRTEAPAGWTVVYTAHCTACTLIKQVAQACEGGVVTVESVLQPPHTPATHSPAQCSHAPHFGFQIIPYKYCSSEIKFLILIGDWKYNRRNSLSLKIYCCWYNAKTNFLEFCRSFHVDKYIIWWRLFVMFATQISKFCGRYSVRYFEYFVHFVNLKQVKLGRSCGNYVNILIWPQITVFKQAIF